MCMKMAAILVMYVTWVVVRKLSFPLLKKAPYVSWLKLDMRFHLNRWTANVNDDNQRYLKRTTGGPTLYSSRRILLAHFVSQ